jgi:hypothetical protein
VDFRQKAVPTANALVIQASSAEQKRLAKTFEFFDSPKWLAEE